MCEICLQNPCVSRCPNAPEPKPDMICSVCGEGIFEGDEYFEGNQGAICGLCMDDKSYKEILDLFGEGMKTA